MAYIGGQHLYPSARKAAKKKTPKQVPPIVWKKAVTTGSGTFPGISSLFGQVGSGGGGGGGQGGGGGGGNPYSELIQNMLNQTRADTKADSIADAAQRDAAIRRLLISYGETPDLAGLGISGEASGVLGQVMDAKTRALAAQNTAEGTSISARIGAANKIAQREIPATLAARGLARSGQTGYALGQQALQNKQTLFDTLNEMLGNVEGAVGSFAANERARQRAMAQAEQEAAWRAADIWGDQDMGYGGGDGGGGGAGGGGGYVDPRDALGLGPSGTGNAGFGSSPTGMLSRSRWLSMHPGGNYQNYVNAYKARHKPIYMGGAYRY